MPTSVRGRNSRPARSAPGGGFTLIELLVVLVIIGIALGAVVLKLMPDDAGQLRDEAGQLALLMENAEAEARSSGVSMAWLPDNKGYQFWIRNEEGNWKPVEDGPYRFRPWHEKTQVASVLIDGDPLKFGERMLLSATGFTLPYEIRLTHGAALAMLKESGDGTVSVQMEEIPGDPGATR